MFFPKSYHTSWQPTQCYSFLWNYLSETTGFYMIVLLMRITIINIVTNITILYHDIVMKYLYYFGPLYQIQYLDNLWSKQFISHINLC